MTGIWYPCCLIELYGAKACPIPHSQEEKMIDKGYKTHTLAMRLRELGGGYAMMVDADDLVSCHLAEFINKHPHENGFYVKTGDAYFVGDDYMKVLPKFSSGTACIVNYAVDDLPSCYPKVLMRQIPNNGKNTHKIPF